MVHQHPIGRIQPSVLFAVHRELLPPDPHVRIAARHVAPHRHPVLVRQFLRLRRAGTVAVCHHHAVRSNLCFHAAHQQVIVAAACRQETDPRYADDALHGRTINYFAIQSQAPKLAPTAGTLYGLERDQLLDHVAHQDAFPARPWPLDAMHCPAARIHQRTIRSQVEG